ncbi:hypothetical protein ACFFWC_02925 [Plantactinospora siamensis]|uniref:Uncharacterized protein n=1 Tax=Plantactinospora siamensis TaxID=555372 RepID=A0ABV6NQL4_9ACTN
MADATAPAGGLFETKATTEGVSAVGETAPAKKPAPARKAATKKTAAPRKGAPARKAVDPAATPAGNASEPTHHEPPAQGGSPSRQDQPPGDEAVPPRAPAPAVREQSAPAGRTPMGAGPVRRVLDRPDRAAELLAQAAVELVGPRARDWAARTREAYPAAGPDGLARLASRRYTRLAGAGALLATATGLLAPVAELAAVAWAQAGLILHLAAAYDRDPTDPERVVDLLVLTGAHPDAASARDALGGSDRRPGVGDQPVRRLLEGGRRIAAPFAAQSSGWMALRLAARGIPGGGPLTAAAANADATQRLAARAAAHFRNAGR